ncbi:MAG: hypothetical protein ACTSQJ_11710 [Promethearchaeota archaeon]
MGVGKAFAFGLILFVALNFVFSLLLALVAGYVGSFFEIFMMDTFFMAFFLFGPLFIEPGITWSSLIMLPIIGPVISSTGTSIAFTSLSSSTDLMYLYLFLGGFVGSPLIAALITGKMAEGKGKAFIAWLLVCMVSVGVIIGLLYMSNLMTIFAEIGAGDILMMMIIYLLTNGIIFTFLYGCFALLAAGSEYY